MFRRTVTSPPEVSRSPRAVTNFVSHPGAALQMRHPTFASEHAPMMIAHPADDSSMTDTLRMGARLLQHKFQHPRRRSEDLADWPGRGIDLRCRRQLGNHSASRAECQIFGLTGQMVQNVSRTKSPKFPPVCRENSLSVRVRTVGETGVL